MKNLMVALMSGLLLLGSSTYSYGKGVSRQPAEIKRMQADYNKRNAERKAFREKVNKKYKAEEQTKAAKKAKKSR